MQIKAIFFLVEKVSRLESNRLRVPFKERPMFTSSSTFSHQLAKVNVVAIGKFIFNQKLHFLSQFLQECSFTNQRL